MSSSTMIQNVNRADLSGVDRISILPDELLNQILSQLPTKDAVATSILSKRWRRVYTLITNLEFDASPLYDLLGRPECIACFTSFMKTVLQARQSNNLSRFCIKADNDKIERRHESHRLPDLEPSTVDTWISVPLVYGITELDLCIFASNEWIMVPSQLFSSSTLQVLKLQTNLDPGNPKSFNLPNLKVCQLKTMTIPEPCFVDRLLLGCPSLEDFALDDCCCRCEMETINISKPALRRLVLYIHTTWDYSRTKVVLDTPNLQYFEYNDDLAFEYSIGNMNALDEANVHIYESNADFKSLLSLLRPLTNVAHLTFISSWVWLEFGYKLPVFYNVKHLHLCLQEVSVWHRVVLEFLNCSPSLESLTLSLHWSMEPACNWCRRTTERIPIPCCLRSHLKRVVIDDECTFGARLGVAEYFLRNASILQELELHTFLSEGIMSMERALANIPKASPNCSLKIEEAPYDPFWSKDFNFK